MRLSRMISELQLLLHTYGDMPVYYENGEWGATQANCAHYHAEKDAWPPDEHVIITGHARTEECERGKGELNSRHPV